MTFGATPVDGSSTPIPMSSVVPDGTNTPIALEGGPSLSTGGNLLAPASMWVKDGNDTTQGTMNDAAVVGDNNGSISAKLRGLTKIFNDVWDSTNHLFATNLKFLSGTSPSPTNPFITESNIQNWLRNAQVYTVTSGDQSGATQTSGVNLFNASTAKNALIFSVFVQNSNPGQGVITSLRKVVSNPSYSSAITPVNNAFSSSASSLMSATWQASATVAGTDVGTGNFNSTNSYEMLTAGRVFLLGSGLNSGLSVFVGQAGTGGGWAVTITYAEF